MKIANFVRIIDGELRTSPPIDAFATIHLEASRVTHGDLFIDVNNAREQVHEALSRGAYAIVTSLHFHDEDEECAWIEVTSIEQALIKLLRYSITQKSIQLIVLSEIQEALFEMIQTPPKQYKRLRGDLYSMSKVLLNAKENECFYISNHFLANKIAPSAKSVTSVLHVKPIVAKGLFLSSFWHQDSYYSDQKIPSFFVEELLDLLRFCDEEKIAYTLEHLMFCEHFYPQFITHALCKKEFGTSDKVLIFEPSASLFTRALSYMKRHLDGQKLLVCIPQSNRNLFNNHEYEIFFFQDANELIGLNTMVFHYALILGDKESFEVLYPKLFTTQPTLF